MEFAQFLVTPLPFILISFFTFLCYYLSHKNGGSSPLPLNWPVFGMIPGLLLNVNRGRFGDWLTGILQQTHGNFMLKGPWFMKMEMLATADPDNISYLQVKHHDRFHRGVNFNQIFDVLGDGIFNSDHDKWKYQRKIALSALSSARFRALLVESIEDELRRGLIPVLEQSCRETLVVDLQNVLQNLTSDITCTVLLGHFPKELSLDPASGCSFHERIHQAEEAVFLRHIFPIRVWKLQKWLDIGKERTLREAMEVVDGFFYGFLKKKRKELTEKEKESESERGKLGAGADLISHYIKENHEAVGHGFKSPDSFLRDTFFTFMLAGADTVGATLTWFFWLLSTHPRVEAKIIEELQGHEFGRGCDTSQLGDSSKMVYLHAALCETLRLYPPVPFNHRASMKPEVLPSGHRVKPSTMIILCAYAMGRMSRVWGDNCEEFRPERWITDQGGLRHEPAHKFFAFNAGPRACIGKDTSFVLMKAVVCAVMRHGFRFEMVEGHRVEPAPSVVLWMKHGLKVKVIKSKGSGLLA